MLEALDEPTEKAVQAYLETLTASSTPLEAKSKLIEQWNALCIYRVAAKLAEGGNKVHLLGWFEKPLLENLGMGTVDAMATMLGNSEALQMYGSVMDTDLSEAVQALLHKYVKGNALQLYRHEIAGVDGFVWKPFPKALIVSEGAFRCETMEDRLTEVKELYDFMAR